MSLNTGTGAYQGAEFVTFRAEDYAQGKSESIRHVFRVLRLPIAKLKNFNSYTESDLDAFTECFDKGLKGNFSEGSKPQFVRFGSPRDNDSRCDVKGGRLMLPG